MAGMWATHDHNITSTTNDDEGGLESAARASKQPNVSQSSSIIARHVRIMITSVEQRSRSHDS